MMSGEIKMLARSHLVLAPRRACSVLALLAVLIASVHVHAHSRHDLPQSESQNAHGESYVRTEAHYEIVSATLTDMHGTRTKLHDALAKEHRPVILQFIFTSCAGVCPILSAVMAGTQDELGSDIDDFALWSISIDPEYDTPERLRRYAEQFGARAQWRFFTGALEDIIAVQKAFDAYSNSKTEHRQLTFIRHGNSSLWLRLEGTAGPAELAKQARIVASQLIK